MKEYLLMLGVALLLLACSEARIKTAEEKIYQKEGIIEIDIQRRRLTSDNKELKDACQIFNDRVDRGIDSLMNSLKKNAALFYKDFGEDPEIDMSLTRFELIVRDSLFKIDKEFLSVRYLVYVFEGGAHGMTYFYSLNYDITGKQFLGLGQIVNISKEEEINSLLEENFIDVDECFTEIPTLSGQHHVVNIDENNLTFTYQPYELGAYACGYTEISIPLESLKGIYLLKNK